MNVLKIKENPSKPGELTMVWKFECFEDDQLTAISIWKVQWEIGKVQPAEGPEDEESSGCVIATGSKSNCL